MGVGSGEGFSFASGDGEDYFALDFFGAEVGVEFLEGASGGFLVELANFAGDAGPAVRAEDFYQRLEGFNEAIGAFVEDEGALFLG